MRLYRIWSYEPDGVFWTWYGSKAEARRAIPQLMDDTGCERGSMEIEAVDVPTRKADLIAWLNHNAPDHNG